MWRFFLPWLIGRPSSSTMKSFSSEHTHKHTHTVSQSIRRYRLQRLTCYRVQTSQSTDLTEYRPHRVQTSQSTDLTEYRPHCSLVNSTVSGSYVSHSMYIAIQHHYQHHHHHHHHRHHHLYTSTASITSRTLFLTVTKINKHTVIQSQHMSKV